MTSSSACDSRFFFFNDPTSEPEAEAEVPEPGPIDDPLLVPTLVPLSVLERPLEWVPSAEDDSPFWALLRQESSEDSCPCPAPFDCMLLLKLLTTLRLKWIVDVAWECGECVASPRTTPDRPVITAEAPGSPAPSAAEARCFFRGGGDAPPVSESEEEEAEARVSSPRAAVVRSRRSSGWETKVKFPGFRPRCRTQKELSLLRRCHLAVFVVVSLKTAAALMESWRSDVTGNSYTSRLPGRIIIRGWCMGPYLT